MKVKSSLLVPAITLALIGTASTAVATIDKGKVDKVQHEQVGFKKSDDIDELVNQALKYASPSVKEEYQNNLNSIRSLKEELGKKMESQQIGEKKIKNEAEMIAIKEKVKAGKLSKAKAKEQLIKIQGGKETGQHKEAVSIDTSNVNKDQLKEIEDNIKSGKLTKEQALIEFEKLPGIKIVKINKEEIKNAKEAEQTDLEQQLQEAINKKDQKTIEAIITKFNTKMKYVIEEMKLSLNGKQ
ncbi:hypothetical protein [Bacillus sp. EAC]|uniref:hypothetical protein n=1 Tax=Bacillus sp. EAC TaxID=1978338 RepID=UPI000B43267E|nr:hypothetical protein [Bacillus sp. EAC]